MRESTRSQSGPNLRDARVGARFPRNLTAPTPVPGGAFPETRLGPMSVDKETVAKIARLARVRVDEGHKEALAKELSNILGWIEHLSELAPHGADQLTQVVPLKLPLRGI